MRPLYRVQFKEGSKYKMLKYIFILFCIIFLLSSCDFFATRIPESPDTGGGSFNVPLDPETVINNFKSAVNEKNMQNYLQCFSDSNRNKMTFYFIPTAEVMAIYPTIFQNWSIENEKRYFSSMINSMANEIFPELTLSTNSFQSKLPDSAIFISDYYLKIRTKSSSVPDEYKGRIQLTISIDNSGLWSISRWIDTKIQDDSINSTWSLAKALFSN